MNKKDFSEWSNLKEIIHGAGRIPAIKEGEIWWCAVGENIGIEINGKNKSFSRPVLIFKKLSRLGFMGIPLTSQDHNNDWYVPFTFKGRKSLAVLAQTRIFSVSRLYDRIGMLPKDDFERICQGFMNLYSHEEKIFPQPND